MLDANALGLKGLCTGHDDRAVEITSQPQLCYKHLKFEDIRHNARRSRLYKQYNRPLNWQPYRSQSNRNW
jgi:hypothetical protein